MSAPATSGHNPVPPPLGRCRFCGDDTWAADSAGPAHPCCVIHAIENPGQPCIACVASRQARRRRHELGLHDDHPDDMCERCRPAPGDNVSRAT